MNLSLALAVILTLSTVVSAITTSIWPDDRTKSLGWSGTIVLAFVAAGFCHAFVRSRRENYRHGAWLTIAAVYVFLTAFMILYPESAQSLAVAYAVAVLIATVFLDVARTVRVVVLTVAFGFAAMPVGDMEFIRWVYAMAILLVVTAITMLYAVVRESDLAELSRLRALEMAESDRLRDELELARTVQQAMVPAVLPTADGIELAAYTASATEASGDYYDLFLVDEGSDPRAGSLVLVVCDVAGKGMASALVMSAARAAIRSEAERVAAPGTILERINQFLVGSIPSRLFLTVFVGVLDLATDEMRFASGGHPHPHRWSQREGRMVDLVSNGLPVGLVPDATYEEESVQLEPGDFVIAYTDGLVEAMNANGDLYGFDDVRRDVRRCIGETASAKDRVGLVVQSMEHFVDGEPYHDDVTIVGLSIVRRAVEVGVGDLHEGISA
jgi:serine phosphatase RsbU (regulator of sigma subunit)